MFSFTKAFDFAPIYKSRIRYVMELYCNELCENLRAGSEATSELASPSDPKEA